MTSFTKEEQNRVLDHLIEARRSVRKFKDEAPPRPMIEAVLQAGLLAPYAQLSVTREDFRRFVVVPRESERTVQLATLMKRRGAALYEELEKKAHQDHFFRERGNPYIGRLKAIGQQGMPNLGKAPYYIVVAEERGVPAAADESIAHCLENMWLKATALGLGFQLLSLTEQMAEDKEFCDLIEIPFDEFALNGCLIGYPDASPPPSKRPLLDEVAKWV